LSPPWSKIPHLPNGNDLSQTNNLCFHGRQFAVTFSFIHEWCSHDFAKGWAEIIEAKKLKKEGELLVIEIAKKYICLLHKQLTVLTVHGG